MVRLEGARKAPPATAGRRLALPGKAGAGGARSGLESLAGFEHPRMDTVQHGCGGAEIGKVIRREIGDGERQTRSRIADGYFNVNNKISIRNDLHTLHYVWADRRIFLRLPFELNATWIMSCA
jgi:hypothetical protein